jgi:hypothetical protein
MQNTAISNSRPMSSNLYLLADTLECLVQLQYWNTINNHSALTEKMLAKLF